MYTKLVTRKTPAKWIVPSILFLFLMLWTMLHYYRFPVNMFFKSASGYEDLIKAAAKRHDIDPALLMAVVWHESRFNPNAKGAKGEVGLMQIRPKNGAVEEWSAAHDIPSPRNGLLFVPELNLEIGAWYLARAMRKWAPYKYQIELALSEYNAGATGMASWIPKHIEGEVANHITIASTRRYVVSIKDKYQWYVKQRKSKESTWMNSK